jgi:hypothetical protein
MRNADLPSLFRKYLGPVSSAVRSRGKFPVFSQWSLHV